MTCSSRSTQFAHSARRRRDVRLVGKRQAPAYVYPYRHCRCRLQQYWSRAIWKRRPDPRGDEVAGTGARRVSRQLRQSPCRRRRVEIVPAIVGMTPCDARFRRHSQLGSPYENAKLRASTVSCATSWRRASISVRYWKRRYLSNDRGGTPTISGRTVRVAIRLQLRKRFNPDRFVRCGCARGHVNAEFPASVVSGPLRFFHLLLGKQIS